MTTTFSGKLNLTIVDAKDLKNDNFGKKDPYCNVSLGTAGLGGILDGQGIGKERFKTKTHENAGIHPKWNESHVFDLHGMKPEVRLKIALYDKDMFKDDYLGLAEITLSELIKRKDDLHYFDLTEKGKEGRIVGQIGLIAKFDCTQIPDSIQEGQSIEQKASVEPKESVGFGEKISQKVALVKDKILGHKDTTEDVHDKEVISKDIHPTKDIPDVPGVHREHHIHVDEPQHHRHHLAGDIDKFGRDEPQHHRHHLAGDVDKFGRDHNKPRMGVSEPVDNPIREGQNMPDMGHDRYRVEPGIIVHDPSQRPDLTHGQMENMKGHDQGHMKGQFDSDRYRVDPGVIVHDPKGMQGDMQKGQMMQGQQGQIQGQSQQIREH